MKVEKVKRAYYLSEENATYVKNMAERMAISQSALMNIILSKNNLL